MSRANYLRMGRTPVVAPTLNDTAYSFGKFTAAGAGGVRSDSSTLGLLKSSGGTSVMTWSWTWVSGGAANLWTTSSVNTPVPSALAAETLTGTVVFTVTATNSAGVSNTATVTITILADACTIGDVTAFGAAGCFSSSRSATSAQTAGVTRVLFATGMAQYNVLVFDNSWTFSSPMVTFTYSDPARPTFIRGIQITGSYVRMDGVYCRRGVAPNPNIAVNANIYFPGMNNAEVVNCNFVNSEQEFYTNNNQFSAIRIESGSNVVADNNWFQHNYMFIYLVSGSNYTLTNNKGRYFHARPHFFGRACDGVLEESNVYWAPFRTQQPYDTGTHMDYLMSEDNNGTTVTKNRTARYNVVLPADTMTTARGWVSGGSGVSAKPGTVIIHSNILCNWGADVVEFTGFENASEISNNCFWMVLTWGPGNTTSDTTRNRFSQDTRCTVDPASSANVGVGASLAVTDNVVSRTWDFGLYATTLLGTVITVAGNVEANKRGSVGAPTYNSTTPPWGAGTPYSAGFVTGMDPNDYLMSFTDWDELDVSQWATVRQRAWTAFERTDGKGAVASGGGGFNP